MPVLIDVSPCPEPECIRVGPHQTHRTAEMAGWRVQRRLGRIAPLVYLLALYGLAQLATAACHHETETRPLVLEVSR